MADGSNFDAMMIRKILDSSFGGKVEHRKDEYALIGRVFKGMGGSWEAITKGSPHDISLLKKVIKYAYRHDHITKKSVP